MNIKLFFIRLLIVASLACGLLAEEATAQDKNALFKTWNLVRSRSMKDNAIAVNPFRKLRLDEQNMHIVFNVGFPEMLQSYTLENDKLKGRFTTYNIESLTDSTLTLSVPDGLKMFFLGEGRSPCGDSLIIRVGDWNDRPYYKATSYLMPILTGETLFKQIENAIHFDRLKEKVSVEFVFVIDETGAVQDAKIMHGYSAKVDAIVLETLQKSSGKWKAPIACGVPVATALAQRYEYDPIPH